MCHNSLLLASILSLIYITSCSPRVPENTSKSEASQSTVDIENLNDPVIAPLLNPDDADYDKREWTEMRGMWGKRGWNNLNNMWGKRDWNKLNNMWGKRETGDIPPYWGKRDWNKLSNVWGKRGWNNLNNMWGKRGWNNLSNVWGKRTTDKDDGSKRTTQWNNLRSMWGKRAADWDIPTVWDKIPADETLQGLYLPDQM
ncbi:prothoracicostatic peptides [Parasteatoda tepidariorum]